MNKKKSLEDLLYEVHQKTEELYELSQELNERVFQELDIEDRCTEERINSQLNTLEKLVDELQNFNQSIDWFDEPKEYEPDWDLMRDEQYEREVLRKRGFYDGTL